MSLSPIEERTNLEHFNFYLREFVSQLMVVYPKGKQSLETAYSELISNPNYKDDKFIKLFMRKVYPITNMIREKDVSLFSKECLLIEGFNFAELWACPKLTENSKKSVWKYLTLLYVYGRTVVSPQNQIEKMLKNFETFGDEEKPVDASAEMLQNMLNNLKEKNELGDDKEDEEEKGSGLPFNMNLDSLLGGNSFLKNIMTDIKDEFKDIEMPENPTDIGSVFKTFQNPATQAKMQNIMGKMAKHFEGGSMGDLSGFQAQAQKMMANMGINTEQLQEQAKQMGATQAQLNNIKNSTKAQSTRERLQKKLQAKQQQQKDNDNNNQPSPS